MTLNTNFTDPEVIGNYIEGVFWTAVGIVLVISGQKANSAYRVLSIVASVSFMVFGISDFVEAQTGAWWRPLSLLVWKASCIVVLASCYWRYRRIRARLASQAAGSDDTGIHSHP
jgi:hypothetical protein